jgi:glycosyltransferase involved in cell wall biosynthesis
MFTGCSSALYGGPTAPAGRWETLYNSVELATYTATAMVPEAAPLVFLGRIERIKGTHGAIAIARTAGRPLVIAGVVADQAYFAAEVAPHLAPGMVDYIGEIDDAGKNALLGQAAALLMPIEWDEPFGIVMIEALACGTPVIAYRRGSVPEVIENGVTGFVVDDVATAAIAVAQLRRIDRDNCRREVERRFSSDAIVDACVALYERMLDGRHRSDH